MKQIIKGFQQFVNESFDLSGQQVDLQNAAFLSDKQIRDLELAGENIDDLNAAFGELENAMVDPLVQMLGTDPNEMYYFDISVDLEFGTYTLHGVYEANHLENGVEIIEPIKDVRTRLPITLPLPKVVNDILYDGENNPNVEDLQRIGLAQPSIKYQRIDGPSEEDWAEYRQLAKDWTETSRQNPRDAHSKFGTDKMNRFRELAGKINNPRNRR